MTNTKKNLRLNHFTCCLLALSTSSCSAKDNTEHPKIQTQPSNETRKPATSVTTEKIRATLSTTDERVFETPLGTLVIKRSDNVANIPGKIYLNNELIYTARSEGTYPDTKGMPFNLSAVNWEENGKARPQYRITRLVVQEISYTCQYIVLDFTGPKVWLSKRFPEGFQRGQCFEMTWVRWEKNLAYFYFGADESDWEKGKYQGWVEGYNFKLKAVFGPVDAPPPPRRASLVPRPVHLIEAEKKGL